MTLVWAYILFKYGLRDCKCYYLTDYIHLFVVAGITTFGCLALDALIIVNIIAYL